MSKDNFIEKYNEFVELEKKCVKAMEVRVYKINANLRTYIDPKVYRPRNVLTADMIKSGYREEPFKGGKTIHVEVNNNPMSDKVAKHLLEIIKNTMKPKKDGGGE